MDAHWPSPCHPVARARRIPASVDLEKDAPLLGRAEKVADPEPVTE